MINRARKEIKTFVFFIIYFILGFLAEKAIPSSACNPGAGFLLFLLSIPTSIVLALVLLFKYYKSENIQYVNSFYIILGIWTILFLLMYFNN
ncbi:hypothetical protein EYY60_00615 [Flavobacterium zhairuonense]|uniref:hypothetical protein n=1 Tax=Flavobacterium zhairuonense TaxID=2493631 RepID=UPI001044340B|nr:hypothetical protein [Flavobacterium zhairuonense]KAF2517428.1 hypothetical protein EYY60_00615 [Flavobacterium zhairuonense]